MASNNPPITGRSQVYGLIGDPVDHSLSPIIQNIAFRSADLDAVYVAWRVQCAKLRLAVAGLKALGVRGFNVTTPHKTAMTRLVDKLEPLAAQIRSVNTVTNERGKLAGYNTDGVGALNALREAGANPKEQAVLLIGAGGAARALAYALGEQGSGFTLMNRTLSKARHLVKQLKKEFNVNVKPAPLSINGLHSMLGQAQIIVNASSMGMNGKFDLPIKPTWLRPEHYVFELVYRPLETRLLQYASLAGARTITGLDMLVNQGACAFSLWTGRKAPVAEMRQAIVERLPSVGVAAS